MVRGMADRDNRRHSRHDLGVALDRLDHGTDRREAIRDMAIGGAQPFVARLACDFDLAALHDYPRARKRRLERSRLAPPHDSAAMVEMEMRQDHVRDVAGFHPERL